MCYGIVHVPNDRFYYTRIRIYMYSDFLGGKKLVDMRVITFGKYIEMQQG